MTVKDVKDPGEADFSLGPFHLILSGKLAYQSLAVCLFLLAGGWVQSQIMTELRLMRRDILDTKIDVQALIEAMPASQQEELKKDIAEKQAVLNLAQQVQR
jgi:hypothetical protein